LKYYRHKLLQKILAIIIEFFKRKAHRPVEENAKLVKPNYAGYAEKIELERTAGERIVDVNYMFYLDD
jgi:hypothetical protein